MNRAKNTYADALATLASWLSIPKNRAVDVSITHVEQPAHCMTIEEADPVEELPWYHDIKVFLESSSPPPGASAVDRKTLSHLASKYVIGAGHLYRRSYNQMLLRCVNKKEADTLMLQVHAGTYGPHMNGVLLTKKIMLQGYFWSTMEADYCQFVRKCHSCQIHGNFIHCTACLCLGLSPPGGSMSLVPYTRQLPTVIATFRWRSTTLLSGWKQPPTRQLLPWQQKSLSETIS